MEGKYIVQNGDSGRYFLMLPLKTKNEDRARDKVSIIVNDLLSACTLARKHEKQKSPEFCASLKKIEKILWQVLGGK